MAYTEADLNAIRLAIAEGALIVQYGDKRIQYRSLEDLLKIEQIVAGQVVTEGGAKGFGRSFRKYYQLQSDLS